MSDIKSLKCACCKYYDTFDGCTAWSCTDDFEISIEKTKEAAENYGLDVYEVLALIYLEKTGGSR